jgi:hypothetical protein
LVAGNHISQLHLNVAKKLILCDPATGMRKGDVTKRSCDHRPGGCGGHPIARCIFTGDHVHFRSKIDGSAKPEIVRTARRTFASVIDAVDRKPGNWNISTGGGVAATSASALLAGNNETIKIDKQIARSK